MRYTPFLLFLLFGCAERGPHAPHLQAAQYCEFQMEYFQGTKEFNDCTASYLKGAPPTQRIAGAPKPRPMNFGTTPAENMAHNQCAIQGFSEASKEYKDCYKISLPIYAQSYDAPFVVKAGTKCESYGLKKGTRDYADCMMKQQALEAQLEMQQRQLQAEREARGSDLLGATGLMLLNNSMARPSTPTNCTVWNSGARVGAVGTVSCY